MREHQIVINLKREHFEEVQRRARLAGSKSAGVYLRDRVIDLISRSPDEEDEVAGEGKPIAENLRAINQELARMHSELQVFIAESLSNVGAAEETPEVEEMLDPSTQAYLAYRQLQESLDLEEQLSGTTYGAMPGVQKIDAGGAGASIHPSPFNISDAIDAGAWSSYASLNFVDPLNPSGVYPAESSQRARDPMWLSTQQGQVSGYPAGQERGSTGGDTGDRALGHTDDDLETLAERAFAISPRLGPEAERETQTRGSRRPQADDPLKDLIDDTIIEQAQLQRLSIDTADASGDATVLKDDVVYAFDEPVPPHPTVSGLESDNSIAQAQSPGDQGEADADMTAAPAGTITGAAHAQPEQDNSTASQPAPSSSAEEGAPTRTDVSSDDTDDTPVRRRHSDDSGSSPDGIIGGISGGPPPKRRKK